MLKKIIDNLEEIICLIALTVMTVLTFTNVVTRYVFNFSMNFAEEISNEKMAGRPYILGEPYPVRQIESSVKAMTTDPIAYSLLALDRQRGRTTLDADRSRAQFTQQYLNPARQLVEKLLQNPLNDYDAIVCQAAGGHRL